ncbi:MAG: hypothetical protein R3A45_04865 [Bdellovibrionota bacterium]
MPVWMMIVEWLARAVFVLLVGLSVWSVKIMLERKKYFADMHALADDFWQKMPTQGRNSEKT